MSSAVITLSARVVQYTSRAAQLYKRELEKEVAKAAKSELALSPAGTPTAGAGKHGLDLLEAQVLYPHPAHGQQMPYKTGCMHREQKRLWHCSGCGAAAVTAKGSRFTNAQRAPASLGGHGSCKVLCISLWVQVASTSNNGIRVPSPAPIRTTTNGAARAPSPAPNPAEQAAADPAAEETTTSDGQRPDGTAT